MVYYGDCPQEDGRIRENVGLQRVHCITLFRQDAHSALSAGLLEGPEVACSFITHTANYNHRNNKHNHVQSVTPNLVPPESCLAWGAYRIQTLYRRCVRVRVGLGFSIDETIGRHHTAGDHSRHCKSTHWPQLLIQLLP